MPNQVWQADDGSIFQSKEECQKYEKVKKDIGMLMDERGRPWEKELGLQKDFRFSLTNGFGNFKGIWEYRESFIRIASILKN